MKPFLIIFHLKYSKIEKYFDTTEEINEYFKMLRERGDLVSYEYIRTPKPKAV